MKVQYEGQELNLEFNENGSVFALYDEDGEMFDRLDPAAHMSRPEPNMAWVSETYVDLLVSNGVVEKTDEMEDEGDGMMAHLVRIIHPNFNDDGFGSFGDFCRNRLGQQCQYGSRYIDGRLDGYPNLGEGLRFNNGKIYGQTRELDTRDYHGIRIHRDDMDEFERRYKAYRPNNAYGLRTELVEWLRNG